MGIEKLHLVDEDARAGVKRADWHQGPFTVVRYTYEAGSVFPTHDHTSAQLTIVLSGRIVFRVGDEEIALGPGEAVYIPPECPHGAAVPPEGGPVVSFNIFHPPRKEHP